MSPHIKVLSLKSLRTLAAVAILFCLISVRTNAYMLTPDKLCPAGRAQGNATIFDISTLFKWPVHLIQNIPTGDRASKNPRTYEYWIDPCEQPACPGAASQHTHLRVCQHADAFYDCGDDDNVQWLWNGNYTVPELTLTLGAPYFGSWRASRFLIRGGLPDNAQPTIEMTGEEPFLLYNFEINAPTSAIMNQGFKTASLPVAADLQT